jgi:DNA-binding transcriptional regulator LsrR (DeoR family)
LGREQVLDVEDWAEIRRLHRSEGMPIKTISRVMKVSRNTVRAALRSDGPPKYERSRAVSIVDEVEPRIRELLRAWPTMPATVIAERTTIREGLQGSPRALPDTTSGSSADANWVAAGTFSAATSSRRGPLDGLQVLDGLASRSRSGRC